MQAFLHTALTRGHAFTTHAHPVSMQAHCMTVNVSCIGSETKQHQCHMCGTAQDTDTSPPQCWKEQPLNSLQALSAAAVCI